MEQLFDGFVPQLIAGRYQVNERLGEGGMSVVYRGRDLDQDRIVAIKALRPVLLSNEEIRRRFELEAQVLRQLKHPNIIPFVDYLQVGNCPFIIMDYGWGDDLGRVLESERRLPLDRSLHIMQGVLGALGKAHSKEIVHRDVKPENIIVDDQGHVWLMDFGVALEGAATSKTRIGALIGTPAYMSPEQARGERVDARSDLYSAAVVLYEMLAGRTPFLGDSEYEQQTAHVNLVPPSLESLQVGAPAFVSAAVAKGLEKDPARRHTSADAFRESLRPPEGESSTNGPRGLEPEERDLQATPPTEPRSVSPPPRPAPGPPPQAEFPEPRARRARGGRAPSAILLVAGAALLAAGGYLSLGPSADAVEEQAKRALAGGRHVEASTLLEPLVTELPQRVSARLLLAAALEQGGNDARARAVLVETLQLGAIRADDLRRTRRILTDSLMARAERIGRGGGVRYEKALVAAIEADPDAVKPQNELATHYLQQARAASGQARCDEGQVYAERGLALRSLYPSVRDELRETRTHCRLMKNKPEIDRMMFGDDAWAARLQKDGRWDPVRRAFVTSIRVSAGSSEASTLAEAERRYATGFQSLFQKMAGASPSSGGSGIWRGFLSDVAVKGRWNSNRTSYRLRASVTYEHGVRAILALRYPEYVRDAPQ